MPTTDSILYCSACKKAYRVPALSIVLVAGYDAGRLRARRDFRVYEGGCFFKTLAKARRAAAGTARTGMENIN